MKQHHQRASRQFIRPANQSVGVRWTLLPKASICIIFSGGIADGRLQKILMYRIRHLFAESDLMVDLGNPRVESFYITRQTTAGWCCITIQTRTSHAGAEEAGWAVREKETRG
jgi:hypothetical protein